MTEAIAVVPQHQSATLGELAKALAKTQAVLAHATKDRENPFFKSTYATLKSVWEACRKPLTDNGLAVVQQVNRSGTEVSVRTMLIHSSGEWVASVTTLPVKEQTAQGYGSAITYGRRYGLAAIVGVAPDDDDDGNEASRPQPQKSPPWQRPSPPTADFAPNRASGVKVPFGRDKGKDLSELDAKALSSLGAYLEKQVQDPSKANFAAGNQRLLDAVVAEVAARG